NDPFLLDRRVQLALLAVLHRLPAIYQDRLNAEVGGLITYGSNIVDVYRQVGAYAGRHPQGREACGFAGRAVERVRACYQRLDRQGARPRGAADATRPRRGD